MGAMIFDAVMLVLSVLIIVAIAKDKASEKSHYTFPIIMLLVWVGWFVFDMVHYMK